MTHKKPAIVLGTGRRFSRGLPASGMQPEPSDHEAVRAGAIAVTVEAFVEFDAGSGYERWPLDWGFVLIHPGDNATSQLIAAATMDLVNDHPVAELGIAGYRVSRWQAAAAPRRLEVDPDLAHELRLD